MGAVELNAVEVEGLIKDYGRGPGKRRAIDGVSLEIREGEVFGLLGPNGAGKTTLVKCLLGLLRARKGEIRIFGKPPQDPKSRVGVGFAPETVSFPGFLSAEEVLLLHGRLVGMDRKAASSAAEVLIKEAGLSQAPKRVRAFSKGMLRRLALAQSLVGSPRLLVLDEPTADLDPIGRREVRLTIESLREHGVTVLLNSHLLSEVERTCDRVAIIHQGRLLKLGTITELVPEGSDLESVFVDLIQSEGT